MKPKEAAYWLNRSIAFRQLEDWDQAERDAAQAVQLQPENDKAIYGRAFALQKLGKTAEALSACEDGLKLDLDHKPLLHLRLQLEREEKAAQEKNGKKESKDVAESEGKSQQSAKATAKPLAKKHDIDYSKWAALEDSDDEDGGEEADNSQEGGEELSSEDQMVQDMLDQCREWAKETSSLLGGTQPPGKVKLPADYKKKVGTLSMSQLAEFTCSNDRMLVSVYGYIFDVSARPDQYGYGPKSYHAGKDITWGVVVGKESTENCNRFYDIFKLDSDRMGRYLQIICQRVVSFENEFGKPVGRLEPFVNEKYLPPPPTDEIEECNQQ